VRIPVVTGYHGGYLHHLLGYCRWQAHCIAHFLPFVDLFSIVLNFVF
jgi:hypothetical protein